MPQQSIVPKILGLLEPFLERLDEEWERQPEQDRCPTLPATDDGKVNVRALTKALGLRQTQEQHFYRHPELASAVNAVAYAQGLKTIGSRVLEDAYDDTVTERLQKVEARSSSLAKILSEREAVIERQRREIESLREQLRMVEDFGMPLRVGEVQ